MKYLIWKSTLTSVNATNCPGKILFQITIGQQYFIWNRIQIFGFTRQAYNKRNVSDGFAEDAIES